RFQASVRPTRHMVWRHVEHVPIGEGRKGIFAGYGDDQAPARLEAPYRCFEERARRSNVLQNLKRADDVIFPVVGKRMLLDRLRQQTDALLGRQADRSGAELEPGVRGRRDLLREQSAASTDLEHIMVMLYVPGRHSELLLRRTVVPANALQGTVELFIAGHRRCKEEQPATIA